MYLSSGNIWYPSSSLERFLAFGYHSIYIFLFEQWEHAISLLERDSPRQFTPPWHSMAGTSYPLEQTIIPKVSSDIFLVKMMLPSVFWKFFV